jgi:hypothetical protein
MSKRKRASGAARRKKAKEEAWEYTDTEDCYECGGQMIWCTICQMYTRTCCEEYGTCMCS